MSNGARPHIVIIGGGFGGLSAAKGLAEADAHITLIDRRNFHLFQPLLYQVATGALSPANIASPLRWILRDQKNVNVRLDEVIALDLDRRRVVMADSALSYDYLVVAAGSRHDYFGHGEWEAHAPGLKTIEDATEIRSRIFHTLEHVEASLDYGDKEPMTFVIVGAGPTGVELAGALAEIVRDTASREFRRLHEGAIKVVLVEAAPRVLPTYPESLSQHTEDALRYRGVEVLTGTFVRGVEEGAVVVGQDGNERRLEAAAVLWAAGVRASPLSVELQAAGAQADRQGRIFVEPDLSLAGHPEVFVIGDLAHLELRGQPLPAVASVAKQQGQYVARALTSQLAGASERPFRYRDLGLMATVGRNFAVADLRGLRLTGLPGWLTWLFVHLMNIAGYENRALILLQWAWSYFARTRSARLITGNPARERTATSPR